MDNIIFPTGQKHIKKTSFEGSPFFNVIVMYFLSHKHDDCCVVHPYDYKPDLNKNIHWFKDGEEHKHNNSCVLLPKNIHEIPDAQTKVSLRWIQNKRKRNNKRKRSSKKNKILTINSIIDNDSDSHGYISVPKTFWKQFKQCPSKRFVVFPFGFTCLDSGHANYMLYDRKNKSLERFESFGKITSSCLNPPNLDKKIFELFYENLGSDLVFYYPPQSFLPSVNFQAKQENEKEWINRNEDDEPVGYCAVWSAWYIDLRLSNPDIDREQLVKIAMKKLESLPINFTTFIRNYSGMIVDVSKEIQKIYNK